MQLVAASDLSARSDRAVARALALAQELDGKLHVLHVADRDLPQELRAHSIAWARQALVREIAALPHAGQVAPSIEVTAGHAKADIIAYAHARNADLLVLGIHNRSLPIHQSFAETTMGKVLRASHLPVLLVRNEASGPYRKVLVGVDFSVFSHAAVRQALRVAPGAQFHLLHAFQVPFKGYLGSQDYADEIAYRQRLALDEFIEEEMAVLGKRARGLGIAEEALVKTLREGPPHKVLREECRRLEADLVVIGTHGRSGISRAIWGSVAAEVLNDPPSDVLVVRAF